MHDPIDILGTEILPLSFELEPTKGELYIVETTSGWVGPFLYTQRGFGITCKKANLIL